MLSSQIARQIRIEQELEQARRARNLPEMQRLVGELTRLKVEVYGHPGEATEKVKIMRLRD